MLKTININHNDFDWYILTDQPTTCGICCARTDFEEINDKLQLHQCLNSDCGYKFITAEDEEFTEMWSE